MTDYDAFKELVGVLGFDPDETQAHDGTPWLIFHHGDSLSTSWCFRSDGGFWSCGTQLYDHVKGACPQPLEESMAELKAAFEARLGREIGIGD